MSNSNQFLIKGYAQTNPNWGKAPTKRTIEELLTSGVINLDKPSGPTSHQVSAWIKKILKVSKAGHGGTLDPHVTGVLPIALGEATKGLGVLSKAQKEYVGIMYLHKPVKAEKLIATSKLFEGKITQLPPIRSAVKRRKRQREIYSFKLIEIKERDVLFRVKCEAGTYIRKLCFDLGEQLGCGAHLKELRRIKTGSFAEDSLVTLHQLQDAYVFWKENEEEDSLYKVIQPVERLFDHLPSVIVRDSAVGALCHGASLALPGILQIDKRIKTEDLLIIKTLKGEAVALARALMDANEMMEKEKGIAVELERVIMPQATYPSLWKKADQKKS
jgi:H/ACA ribonucleoprotein complex subunit 4